MAQDETSDAVSGPSEETGPKPVVHEDIIQRLLEYQRRLREGLSPAEAAAAAEAVVHERGTMGPSRREPVTTAVEPEAVVDITAAEGEFEARRVEETVSSVRAPEAVEQEPVPEGAGAIRAAPAQAPVPPRDLVERVERLERTLEQVAAQVTDLRQCFQDLAIAADERLAELERTLARARER